MDRLTHTETPQYQQGEYIVRRTVFFLEGGGPPAGPSGDP